MLARSVGLAVGGLSESLVRASKLEAVSLLLPRVSQARRQWETWLQLARSSASPVPAGQDMLTGETEARLRYRVGVLDMFRGLPLMAARAWTAWWRVLSAADRRWMWNLLAPAGVFKIGDLDTLGAVLKSLSGVAKKFGDMLFEKWKLLVDLQLLRDYQPSKQIEEFEDDIYDWVGEPETHALSGSQDYFYTLLREGVRKFMRLAPRNTANFRPIALRDWLGDPGNWARSGSSDGARLRVIVEGEVKKARKSKWATALALSVDELLELFWSPAPDTNKAIQKRELGKVRAVLTGCLMTYLRMTRVSTWLEYSLAGHPCTTLFYSAKQQLALWMDMLLECKDITVKMPIDESEYDHHVDARMIRIANEEISAYITEFCEFPDLRAELLQIMECIQRSFTHGTVSVGSKTIPVKKGVLSGWRWTALYDTVLNGGKVEAFRAHIIGAGGGDPVLGYVSQGDDVRMRCPNYQSACALWSLYDETGFIVNPAKFFIATNRDEYLRQVSEPGLTAGYASRALPSLLYRSPVTRELQRGEERMREQCSSWNTVFSRLGYATEAMMVEDMAKGNKVETSVVEGLLRTPACLGGFGYYEDDGSGDWYRLVKGRSVAQWRYLHTPPLARSLGTSFGIKPDALAKLWHANVDPPAKTPVEYEVFRVERILERVIPFERSRWGFNTPIDMAARANPELPGSVASVLADEVAAAGTMAELTAAVARWIDPAQWHLFELYRSKMSLKLLKRWVTGRLPYATPIIPGWSSLAVGVIHQMHAKGAFAWATSFSKITWSRVIRTAATVEQELRATLAQVGWRVAG